MSGAAGGAAAAPTLLEGKVAIVGDQNTGKTSLIGAFTRGEFNAFTKPSIGVAYSKKTITTSSGTTVNFSIWDTAGTERFRSVNTLYYRGAGAAILVYDVTSAQSFESLDYWLKEVRLHGCRDMIIVVCGNKSDAAARARQVPPDAARDFAERNGTLLVETSAKTGANVEELFRMIAREAPRLVAAGGDAGFRAVAQRPIVDLDAAELKEKPAGDTKGSGCCSS